MEKGDETADAAEPMPVSAGPGDSVDFSYDELRVISNRAAGQVHIVVNPLWKQAYLRLAMVADYMALMLARTTMDMERGSVGETGGNEIGD